MEQREDQIRQRAHQLWEESGRPDGQHDHHWLQAEREIDGHEPANEGEGNRTAARKYNKSTTAFAKSGKVTEKAKEAKRALDGAEGAELRKAEKIGRSHSHGEDPAVSEAGASPALEKSH